VAELDAQIAAMKSRLGTSAAGAQDSLQGMLAMVEQKENEAKRLEELKKQREEEERKRQSEIAKLKAEAETRRVAAIEKDIMAYQKIVASPYGKDMATVAWQSLVSKYPEAKNVAAGDISALKRVLNAISETERDGRFIAYDNGTVLDTRTNLMWAAKDNGSNINWANAKSYCENYRGGGFSDWRLPTQDELAELYDKGIGYTPVCAASGDTDKVKLTNLITLSCWWGWASETRSSEAAFLNFGNGNRYWLHQSDARTRRALPVRSGK
jgi:hypothetical protein